MATPGDGPPLPTYVCESEYPIGSVFAHDDIPELVACNDCNSELYWRFRGPNIYELLIAHDETCPAMRAEVIRRGQQQP